MKNLFLFFALFFLIFFNNLKAQEKSPDFFDPIIRKIKETTIALLKSLKPSEDQKKQAQGIMDQIKSYYDILKESVPNLPPSEKDQRELQLLRNKVDEVDDNLLNNLSIIMDQAKKIANLKKKDNLPPFTLEGWELLLIGEPKLSTWEHIKNSFFGNKKLNNFQEFIKELLFREALKIEESELNNLAPAPYPNEKITDYKNKLITSVYNKTMQSLQMRMEVVQKIGYWKKKHQETPFQRQRWKEVLTDRKNKGAIKGLSKEFVGNLMGIIHKESLRIQVEIIGNKN